VTEEILIACIGNIFLGDDGFGFEVAQALAGAALPPEVSVRDFGIRGLDLAYALLCPWKVVILVDAIRRGGQPGSLSLLQPADALTAQPSIDPHNMDPARVLATARSLGKVGAEIYILGCEPRDFGDPSIDDPGSAPGDGRMGLSPPVAAAIPEAVSMIQSLVEKCVQALPQQAA
jgi:hydrogenase maturation protease